jgi:fermentation-respiration switch protein FrsA (DUF1100 family)
LSSLSRDNAAALAPQLAAAREVKKQVESPDLKPDDSVSLLGARLRGAYFLDVRGYDPAAVAATLDLPLLVLQGERDYQVTMKSFAQWQRALGGRKGASLRSYPRDNHLFVRGEGPPSPAEYASPAHVDAAVVDDVASWVLAQPPR